LADRFFAFFAMVNPSLEETSRLLPIDGPIAGILWGISWNPAMPHAFPDRSEAGPVAPRRFSAGPGTSDRRFSPSGHASGLAIALLVATALPAADPAPQPGSAETAANGPREVFAEAVRLFFECRPAESAGLFDRLVGLRPDDEPALWQRGLALYYAGRFADGRRQFEGHRLVNPDDVENAAWHFLCVARERDPDSARRMILPVGPDARVPMAEIYRLFAGSGSAEDVLEAADRGDPSRLRNQRCYAHLYVGLHHEALGDAVRAREHILRAATDHGMDHYMGRVAKVHAVLRGWATKAELQP